MKKIKVYGERNSGTHFVEHLVRTYTRNEVIQIAPSKIDLFLLKTIKFDIVEDFVFSRKKRQIFGWKHGCPLEDVIESTNDENLPIFLTVTKNPYSFLVSLFEKPYHYKGETPRTFSEFIRSEWVCRGRDRISPRKLDNPVQLWNKKNEAFLRLSSLKKVQVVNFTYEYLLEDPLRLKEELMILPQIGLSDDAGINSDTVVKQGEKSYDFYRDYYLTEKWKERLSKEDIQYINRYLDKELVSAFGYELLDQSRLK